MSFLFFILLGLSPYLFFRENESNNYYLLLLLVTEGVKITTFHKKFLVKLSILFYFFFMVFYSIFYSIRLFLLDGKFS